MNQPDEVEQEIQKIESTICPPKKSNKFLPMKLDELLLKEFKDIEWVVESLIPAESTTVISGSPASFKTWLLLTIAVKVASGEMLFNYFPTKKTGVLIIDEESGERMLNRRLKKLNCVNTLPVYFTSLEGFKLADELISQITTYAKEKEIGLIIFDSLVRIHNFDENDASKMSRVFESLKQINKEGIAVLLTHHNRKQGFMKSNPSQDMRGSSDILAAIDCHIAIERDENNVLIITQTKLRIQEELHPFRVVVNQIGESNAFEYDGEVEEDLTKFNETKEKSIELLETESRPMYQKEILEFLKASGFETGSRTLRDALGQLVDEEKIHKSKGERNKIFYSLDVPELESGKNTLSI